jgi:putative NIF3 family GTP cyclohydrolase 1 type 2
MRVTDLHEHCRALDDGWVDWDDTVDGVVAGDPETTVERIAVGWMSYTWAIEEAIDRGCNVFVTHEPTFFNHHDDRQPAALPETVHEEIRRKRRLIAEEGLVVYRCHDLWDRLPECGVTATWGRQLGLGEPVATQDYVAIYEAPEPTAAALADRVAEYTAEDGQPGVQLFGPGDASVSRVAVGTGAITPFPEMIDSEGVDVAICSDDGFRYWRDGAIAIDGGIPAVVVNHTVSELAGIRAMAEHFDEAFDVPVAHVEQACPYELVG